jgi:hypothetical protein
MSKQSHLDFCKDFELQGFTDDELKYKYHTHSFTAEEFWDPSVAV